MFMCLCRSPLVFSASHGEGAAGVCVCEGEEGGKKSRKSEITPIEQMLWTVSQIMCM